ncbi:hypothetical protein BDQ12DRAFT_675858 [Crucibulum laeve]|uniref:Thioesterase domain-containing protein n=1 Tax=Crucibulum laeve TaxID=68775 RepID=A0A5C3MFF4_9AGAR|nr:hypothetical protein BDQ12DRAFT_675858 [Crucibulum laeve]
MDIPQSDHAQRTIAFLQEPLAQEVIDSIGGNAPPEIKSLPVKWLHIFKRRGNSFANSIAERVRVTEVSVLPSPDDAEKLEGKVVCEIEVTQDMCNSKGVMHAGCAVFLMDEGIAVSLVVGNAGEGRITPAGVSQTLNTYFHEPAPVGTRLRIVSTSMYSGYQSNGGRCEIFDVANHRLIASGTQLMMPPSIPAKWM